MNNKTLSIVAIAVALVLAGCSQEQREKWARERNDSRYQSAMADMAAGVLDKAADGFAKVLMNDPANASARFQLACLQQDKLHDYMGAVCNFREYLLQRPNSDKARMAKDRLVLCETELAKDLAVKTGVANVKTLSEELNRQKAEIAERDRQLDAVKKELDEAQRKIDQLNGENARVRQLLAGMNEDQEGSRIQKDSFATAKQVLEEEDGGANVQLETDVKELIAEQEAMLAADGRAGQSSLLPDQPVDAKAAKEAREEAKRKQELENAPKEPAHEKRPAHYTVQEGDTLYKIALRFYGRINAWREIREANKAIVSTDGRIKVGQKLALPRPEIQEDK